MTLLEGHPHLIMAALHLGHGFFRKEYTPPSDLTNHLKNKKENEIWKGKEKEKEKVKEKNEKKNNERIECVPSKLRASTRKMAFSTFGFLFFATFEAKNRTTLTFNLKKMIEFSLRIKSIKFRNT